MPFPLLIPLIMAGLGAAGGALSNRSKKTTQTTTPTMSPEYQPLQKQLLDLFSQRLDTPAFMGGYEAGGIGNINNAYDLTLGNIRNRLTSRGLGGGGIPANAGLTAELSRAGDIAKFQQGLPLLQREMQLQDLMSSLNLLNFGRGSTTVGEYPGNKLGGALGGAGSMLGFMYGQGMLGGMGGGGSSSYPIPDLSLPGTNSGVLFPQVTWPY